MDTSLICPTTMNIRAFDGILKKVQGEIELAIGVGPMFFTVNFKSSRWIPLIICS